MMRWLEIIRHRSARDCCCRDIEKSIRADALGMEPGVAEIVIFRHGEIENDMAIHILWEPPGCAAHGSDLGDRIAYRLREFGMVDHAVWIGGENDE
jgi:hypothetical protein